MGVLLRNCKYLRDLFVVYSDISLGYSLFTVRVSKSVSPAGYASLPFVKLTCFKEGL